MEELCSTQLLALLHCVGLGSGLHLELLHPHCIEVLCKKKYTTKLWPCSQLESLGRTGMAGQPRGSRREIWEEIHISVK